VLSRSEIEGLIADGKYIFILDNKVIKADSWINYHPGGLKAIQHMVGRDATDEVTAFVLLNSTAETYTDRSKGYTRQRQGPR
jgi:cytochrome b involved in lipid metabolism